MSKNQTQQQFIQINETEPEAEFRRDVNRALRSAWTQISNTAKQTAVWTGTVNFTNVAAQKSADFTVQMPQGSTPTGTSCIVLGAPAPPSNSCFSTHVIAGDKVVIRFNNYSAAAISVPSQTFSLVVLSSSTGS